MHLIFKSIEVCQTKFSTFVLQPKKLKLTRLAIIGRKMLAVAVLLHKFVVAIAIIMNENCKIGNETPFNFDRKPPISSDIQMI